MCCFDQKSSNVLHISVYQKHFHKNFQATPNQNGTFVSSASAYIYSYEKESINLKVKTFSE